MEKRKKQLNRNGMYRKQEKYFYGFISLWLIGFFVFILGPMLYSLYASFTDWNGITAPVFSGIKNYVRVFTQDDLVGKSILNTLVFTLVSVPLNLVIGLVLATLLNKRYFASNFFRALFYMPSVIAGVAIYIAWTYLMNTNNGIFNLWLSRLGLEGVGWLTDPHWAMISIILVNATSCGGQMLIILAGLQDIPRDYLRVRHAGRRGKTETVFFHHPSTFDAGGIFQRDYEHYCGAAGLHAALDSDAGRAFKRYLCIRDSSV